MCTVSNYAIISYREILLIKISDHLLWQYLSRLANFKRFYMTLFRFFLFLMSVAGNFFFLTFVPIAKGFNLKSFFWLNIRLKNLCISFLLLIKMAISVLSHFLKPLLFFAAKPRPVKLNLRFIVLPTWQLMVWYPISTNCGGSITGPEI